MLRWRVRSIEYPPQWCSTNMVLPVSDCRIALGRERIESLPNLLKKLTSCTAVIRGFFRRGTRREILRSTRLVFSGPVHGREPELQRYGESGRGATASSSVPNWPHTRGCRYARLVLRAEGLRRHTRRRSPARNASELRSSDPPSSEPLLTRLGPPRYDDRGHALCARPRPGSKPSPCQASFEPVIEFNASSRVTRPYASS